MCKLRPLSVSIQHRSYRPVWKSHIYFGLFWNCLKRDILYVGLCQNIHLPNWPFVETMIAWKFLSRQTMLLLILHLFYPAQVCRFVCSLKQTKFSESTAELCLQFISARLVSLCPISLQSKDTNSNEHCLIFNWLQRKELFSAPNFHQKFWECMFLLFFNVSECCCIFCMFSIGYSINIDNDF